MYTSQTMHMFEPSEDRLIDLINLLFERGIELYSDYNVMSITITKYDPVMKAQSGSIDDYDTIITLLTCSPIVLMEIENAYEDLD